MQNFPIPDEDTTPQQLNYKTLRTFCRAVQAQRAADCLHLVIFFNLSHAMGYSVESEELGYFSEVTGIPYCVWVLQLYYETRESWEV